MICFGAESGVGEDPKTNATIADRQIGNRRARVGQPQPCLSAVGQKSIVRNSGQHTAGPIVRVGPITVVGRGYPRYIGSR